MEFEMNRTWSQAMVLVKSNFQLLAVIAGIFMLLPSLLFYFSVPDVFNFAAVEGNPDAAARRFEAMAPSFLGYGLIALVLQSVGYMAMIALMGDERPTVSESIGRAFRALPTVIGAMILFALAYFVFFILFSIVMGLIGAAVMAVTGAAQGGGGIFAMVGLLYIALFVGVLYIFGRFSVTLPAIVLDREFNPAKALGRSWRLTRQRAWAILGFFALLFVVYIVLAMLMMMVMGALGIAAGAVMGTGSLVTVSLLSGVLGMVAAMLLSAILVSMHGQLAGPSGSQIAETFD